jgi:hypothetical protein
MTTTTAPTATIALTMKGSQFDAGTATVARPADALDDVRVFVVIPDQRAAEHFGVHARAGKTVGGIAYHEQRKQWAPVAYADRQHMRDGSGPVYDLPWCRSRAAAIRALLRWWNLVDVGRVPTTRQPWELSTSDQKILAA